MGAACITFPCGSAPTRSPSELQGFTTVTQNAVEVLVGQTATVNVQMSPSTLAETVTVTGESPLIETTQSKVSGNIDPLQMTEVPVQGNKWLSLALLAPGNRTTRRARAGQDRGDNPRISAESRWTAGDGEPGHPQPAALQQRHDR